MVAKPGSHEACPAPFSVCVDTQRGSPLLDVLFWLLVDCYLVSFITADSSGNGFSVYCLCIIFTSNLNTIDLLVTVHDTQQEESSVTVLRQSLRAHIQDHSFVDFEVQTIHRFGE